MNGRLGSGQETRKKFMDGRLGSGQLYFIRLKTDIHGDSYLIIKKHGNIVGAITKICDKCESE